MKKLISLVLLGVAVMTAAPAFAETAAAGKTLNYGQFAALPENRGIPAGRMMDRKYEEYRHGRAPHPTLSVTELR